MNEKYIVFKKIKINIDLVSKALHIPEEAVIKEFRDGRVTLRFSEYWAAELYNFKKITIQIKLLMMELLNILY